MEILNWENHPIITKKGLGMRSTFNMKVLKDDYDPCGFSKNQIFKI